MAGKFSMNKIEKLLFSAGFIVILASLSVITYYKFNSREVISTPVPVFQSPETPSLDLSNPDYLPINESPQ